ncbi:MAG: type II secretion system F family protein [Oscillospiraceae bacterium]
MKNYYYVAKDTSGKPIKGTIAAETPQDLVNIIQDKNLFLVSYKESLTRESSGTYKFKTKDLSFDCRQLSAMLSSGITLVKALDILYKEQTNQKAKDVWRDIYEDVQKGQSFSSSLNDKGDAFPVIFRTMVAAGESSGTLDTVMNRMSEHFAKENKLNNKVKGAMIYPIILLCLSVAVVIGLATFILPTFFGLFGDAELPPMTQAMMNFSTFLRTKWYFVVLIFIIIVFLIIYALKTPSFRFKVDRWMLKSKAIGKLVGKVYTGRFARTLSSLYSSGIPMVECLERSSAVLGNRYINEEFKQVVDDVKQGESLSVSIQKTGIFESMFCSIVYVGEESGALDDILIKTADYYEEEADSAISKLVSMIEPIMIIIMGIMVGTIIVSIMPAMTQMYNNIT